VKEEIMIHYLGLGWKDAHHPWSSQGVVLNSQQLLSHFIENVLSLAQDHEVPTEPPIYLPKHPDMMTPLY
jgi:hypothetical protein